MKTAWCGKHGFLDENNAVICITDRVKRGWRLRCKECSVVSKKKMYEKNREKHIRQAGEWAENNRERINKRRREDRKENQAKHAAWEKGKYKRKVAKDGDDYRVKQRVRKHGITVEHYYKMIEEQENKCAICGKHETKKSTKSPSEISPLAIDHCHKTNKVRALLCRTCNLGIGAFNDNHELMLKAIEYLKKHTEDMNDPTS